MTDERERDREDTSAPEEVRSSGGAMEAMMEEMMGRCADGRPPCCGTHEDEEEVDPTREP